MLLRGRLRMWFAIIVILLLTLPGCAQSKSQPDQTQQCNPPVGTITLGPGAQEPEVEQRVQAVFEADQAARTGPEINWDSLEAEDAQRRAEVLQYLEDGRIISGWSLYYAAMVLQHGTCTEHYQLANRLTEKSMAQGIAPARWLFAATMDRYLMSQGKPQKYGTQYRVVGDKWELEPVDPATTDAERAQYDVPPLREAQSLSLPVPRTNR